MKTNNYKKAIDNLSGQILNELERIAINPSRSQVGLIDRFFGNYYPNSLKHFYNALRLIHQLRDKKRPEFFFIQLTLTLIAYLAYLENTQSPVRKLQQKIINDLLSFKSNELNLSMLDVIGNLDPNCTNLMGDLIKKISEGISNYVHNPKLQNLKGIGILNEIDKAFTVQNLKEEFLLVPENKRHELTNTTTLNHLENEIERIARECYQGPQGTMIESSLR